MTDLLTLERSETLTYEEICSRIEAGTPRALFESRRVLAITPDATRSAPLPALVRAVDEVIGPHARQLDYMVALGTHPVMSDEAIHRLYGVSAAERGRSLRLQPFPQSPLGYAGDAATDRLVHGTADLRGHGRSVRRSHRHHDQPGRSSTTDLLLIVGPVFPHEIVGFSGGHKYLFPGISGGEFLDFFHWLSAVITCMKTIGHKDTPARRVIERAAELVPTARPPDRDGRAARAGATRNSPGCT